jgi:hypothetical protein
MSTPAGYAFKVPATMAPEFLETPDPDDHESGTIQPEPGPRGSEPRMTVVPEPHPDGSEPPDVMVLEPPDGVVPGSGTSSVVVPAIAIPQQQTGLSEHLLLLLRDWAKRTADSQKRHRSFWHWLWAGFVNSRPDSIAEQVAYLKSRQWLEDHMTGWLRSFAEWENIAFGILIGIPLKVAGNNVSRLGERQWRFWAVATLLAVIAWKTFS